MSEPTTLVVIVIIAIYIAPTIIAIARSHNNGTAIVVLDLLFGWLFIPWLIALIWSFTDNVKKVES